MKKRGISILMSLLLIFAMMPITAFAQEEDFVIMGTEGVDYAKGEAIVCVTGGTSALARVVGRSATSDYEIEEIMDVTEATTDSKLRGLVKDTEKSLVLVKSSQNTENLIAELEANPSVEYAEPNYYIVPYGVEPPEDPGYQYQWGLENQLNNHELTEKTIADIKAVEAWDALGQAPGKTPVVAVIDSGVDYNHPDLKEIMWDDGLTTPGLVEMGGGQYGYNVLESADPDEESTDPMDKDNGHGTHCAGIIGAQWNNEKGGAGVASDVEIMAVRMISKKEVGDIKDALKGYAYIQAAAKAGVNVVAINNSWGPGEFNGAQLRSFSTAATAIGEAYGVISCFAAGNTNTNNDLNTGWNVRSPYVINVGAIQSQGDKARFSSYGMENVDVFAPGTQILSTTTTDQGIPMNQHDMPVQYLPQIQSDGDKNASYFYENFEEDIDVELRLLNGEGQVLGSSTLLTPGYASSQGLKLDLSQIKEGENFSIEMVFDREILEPAAIDTSLFYLAFQCGFDNAMYDQAFTMQYQKADGTWEEINSTQETNSKKVAPALLEIVDYNWNQFSHEVSVPDFMAFENSDKKVVLRLVADGPMTGKKPDEASAFRLDDMGFGKTASDYFYSDGTSMATPIVTGIVALLASKEEEGERAYDAREVAARVKGGVNRKDAGAELSDKSISKGFVDAGASFDEEQCIPVLDNLEINNGEGILTGYFFGTQGTLEIGEREIAASQWTENKITFDIPIDIKGKQEVVLTPEGKEYGRNFFNITTDTKGYKELNVPNFDYGTSNGYPLTSKDLVPFTMVAAGNKVLYLGTLLENSELKMNLYDIDQETWEEISIPEAIGETENPKLFSMAGGLTKFYLIYPTKDEKTMIGTYDPVKKTWTSVEGEELLGTESLVVYKDQLVAVGGDETENAKKSVSILDPNTGKVIGSLPDMPEGRSGSYVSASGDKLMVYGGSKSITKEGIEEAEFYYNTMIFDGSSWKVYDDAFLDPKNLDHDQKQTLDTAISILNDGAIGVGPVKNLAKPEMLDTWRFSLENGTWTGDDKVLYSQTKAIQLVGVATKGQFYVLGSKDLGESGVIFRTTPVDYTGPTADPGSVNPDPPTPDPPTPTPDPPTPTPNPPTPTPPADEPNPSKPAENLSNVLKTKNVGTGLLGNTSGSFLVIGSLLILLAVGICVVYMKRRK